MVDRQYLSTFVFVRGEPMEDSRQGTHGGENTQGICDMMTRSLPPSAVGTVELCTMSSGARAADWKFVQACGITSSPCPRPPMTLSPSKGLWCPNSSRVLTWAGVIACVAALPLVSSDRSARFSLPHPATRQVAKYILKINAHQCTRN